MKKVPRNACCLVDASRPEVTFADAADPEGKGSSGRRRFAMLPVVSGREIGGHWFWGNLAIDLGGVEIPRPQLPALLSHDHSQRVGVARKLEVRDGVGLCCEGEFLKTSQAARTVLEDADDGFPWEASAEIVPLEIEEVEAGEVAEVNGFDLKGPGTVFRRSQVREVSFVAVGADPNTSAQAFASSETYQVRIHKSEECPVDEVQEQATVETTVETVELPQLDLTADEIRSAAPSVAAELSHAGAATERRRVSAILELADPTTQGDLARQLIADGVEIFEATRRIALDGRERLQQAREQFEQDCDPPVGPQQAPVPTQAEPDRLSDASLRARWDDDAAIRAEFVQFEFYAAHERRAARGLLSKVGGKP